MRGSSLIFILVTALFLITSGCYHSSMRQSARLPHLEEPTRILADYQPWFGYPGHIDVGYSTVDTATLRKQIARAKQMGIYGFAVDWYGNRKAFEDRSFQLLEKVAAETDFHVCLMYDETQEATGQATDDALDAMAKAYRDYIGPQSPARNAYITYQGRPVIFIFPKRGGTDWDRVREAVNLWDKPPLLIYKDEPPSGYAKDFDGFYAWVHPGRRWAPDGSDWGKEYLETFYQKMEQRSGKLVVGAVWPGFDDTRASWSLNRHIDRRCGQTFEDTLKIFHAYDRPERPMPFLLIATWNDYEEGTDIETGISHCRNRQASQIAAEGSH